MRINPIKYNSYNTSFGAIKSATKGVSSDILGEKEAIYDYVSEQKDVDIWTFKHTSGGMINPKKGYIVLIQDKHNGNVIKEIEDSDKNVDKINTRLEKSMLWYDAKINYMIANSLKMSDVHEKHPKEAEDFANKLMKVAMTGEAGTWQKRLEII